MKGKLLILLACAAMLVSCGNNKQAQKGRFPFLNELGITIDNDLLLGDSLTLPDIYDANAKQHSGKFKGKRLNHDQYSALVVPAGKNFTDEMSNWVLLGVREMGNGITMCAFYSGNGTGYCVDLLTYDKQGHVLDAINARELHLLWRIYRADINNDSVFTLDGHLTFEGDRATLHRVMGRCVMDFDNDRKGNPIWQQGWNQIYTINAKGHFVLDGQKIVKETGPVDQYAALDFKSWDMLVCSMHDTDIMDTWNEYSELINSTYDPDYKYNPFPWDVTELYRMNPQRFLRWMAAKRESGNRLLPYFKLKPDDRPALMEEIGRLDDNGARQWLTAITKSWDDKPLADNQ